MTPRLRGALGTSQPVSAPPDRPGVPICRVAVPGRQQLARPPVCRVSGVGRAGGRAGRAATLRAPPPAQGSRQCCCQPGPDPRQPPAKHQPCSACSPPGGVPGPPWHSWAGQRPGQPAADRSAPRGRPQRASPGAPPPTPRFDLLAGTHAPRASVGVVTHPGAPATPARRTRAPLGGPGAAGKAGAWVHGARARPGQNFGPRGGCTSDSTRVSSTLLRNMMSSNHDISHHRMT